MRSSTIKNAWMESILYVPCDGLAPIPDCTYSTLMVIWDCLQLTHDPNIYKRYWKEKNDATNMIIVQHHQGLWNGALRNSFDTLKVSYRTELGKVWPWDYKSPAHNFWTAPQSDHEVKVNMKTVFCVHTCGREYKRASTQKLHVVPATFLLYLAIKPLQQIFFPKKATRKNDNSGRKC